MRLRWNILYVFAVAVRFVASTQPESLLQVCPSVPEQQISY